MATYRGTALPDIIVGTLADDTVYDIGQGLDVVNTLDGNDTVYVMADAAALLTSPAIVNMGLGDDLLVIDGRPMATPMSLARPLLDLGGLGLNGALVTGGSERLLYTGVNRFAVYGGSGSDELVTGPGADLLTGGAGADRLTGGAGSDTFAYAAVSDSTTASQDYITDFYSLNDRIDLGAALGSGGVVAISRSGLASTVYFQRADAAGGVGQIGVNGMVQGLDFTVAANTTFYISGDAGPDVIYGSNGVDVINGGGGADNILGNLGADQISSGPGADTIYYNSVADSTPASQDYITDFTSGEDQLNLNLALGAGGTVAIGRSGSTSTLYFQRADGAGGVGQIGVNGVVQGFDLAVASTTTFYFTGDGGSDVIYGSAGRDVINGGGGDDNLAGGLGADVITGGAGADIFYYYTPQESTAGASDTITDFTTGVDRLNLQSMGNGAVNLAYNGSTTTVTFAPTAGGTALSVLVAGEVRASDVYAAAGVTFGALATDNAPALIGHDAAALAAVDGFALL